MMKSLLPAILGIPLAFIDVSVFGHKLGLSGPQHVNLWRLERNANEKRAIQDSSQAPFVAQGDREVSSVKLPVFQAYWFEQPLDHFSNTSHTFGQRYWINTRHYRPGGPVFVLDGGETSGENRLPFLDTGIVDILPKATGAIGVVLEHRYYGESIPVSNFSTDSLRWLNNAQSAADSANFMRNVKFEGVDEDLTAPNTPWIYYGGSYAGARAAHMRILYPDIVYGAIASSGVTHAAIEYWEYMDMIREAAEPKCSTHIQNTIKTVDDILALSHLKKPFKALFGLGDLESDEDFTSVLSIPLGYWQEKTWERTGSKAFDEFCEALARPPLGHLAAAAIWGDYSRLVPLPGGLNLDFTVLNYARYIKENIVSQCPEGVPVEDCFGTSDDYKFRDTGLDQTWRAWTFQVCTEWGYFVTAPPDQKYPRIVSRLQTLQYQSKICQQAFPRGKHFEIPSMPNISAVNTLGDFEIAADRLAIIDGSVDPWRPATPHSQYAPAREDTNLRPFKLIPGGVHHWDEYGSRNSNREPPEISRIHKEMVGFVREWLQDWEKVKAEH